MAGYLGLEWSSQGLRAVEGHGKGAQLSLGGSLLLPAPFEPARAEAVGAELKTQLRAAGIHCSAAIVVVARAQLLCRDLRYPAVPDEERPSLIQFQALKEITLAPEEAVIDFLPSALPWPTGEQRALAFILRKSQLAVYQKLCQAAGLKLEALVPSTMAIMANALPFLQEANPPTALVAAGELTVVLNRQIIFTRAFDQEEPPAIEIRRSLAGYAALFPRQPIQEMFIAGTEPAADLEALTAALRVPVRWYDPLGTIKTASPPLDALPLLPAIGAVQAATYFPKQPVNFVQPKKNQPKPNKRRIYYIGAAAAAAGILLLGGGFYFLTAAEQSFEINRLQGQISEKKKELATFGNLEEKSKVISEWAGQEMIVLDELYDLAARFPDASGIRIIWAEWTPATTTPVNTPRVPVGPKPSASVAGQTQFAQAKKNTKPIGYLIFEVQADSPAKLDLFRRELDRGHWSVDRWERDQGNNDHILAEVRVFPQEAREYVAKVQPGVFRTQPGEVRPEGTRPGRFGGARTPNRGGRP